MRSHNAMSMPEIANAAMPPVVPYHQVSAYSFLPIVSVCSGFMPMISLPSDSTIRPAARAASGK